MPPTREIVNAVLIEDPDIDVNEIHSRTWDRMKKYRKAYFVEQIDAFLTPLRIPDKVRRIVRKALLKPTKINGVRYESFLVGIGRKMSQSIQPRSGKSAELCGEVSLAREELERNVHFAVRDKRSDLTLYHPDIDTAKKTHRVEVKNMKIRERGVRGLAFDGDSLFGFFDDPGEFTLGELRVIGDALEKTGGYVYLPPDTLEMIETPAELNHILRPNTRFGSDMAAFVRTGIIPVD